MKKTFSLMMLMTAAFFISCGDDTPGGSSGCNSLGLSSEFQDEVTAISQAASAFANDPSASNCQAFKNAYLSYIDALEEWEDCARQLNEFAEWQSSIDMARLQVDNLC